jgi:predicted metal-dependent phosphoesterase TrpH
MLKIELHAHTSADPHDYIPHSTTELIDRAASLGYQGLAITLHERWFDISSVVDYAHTRGVTLIRGVEQSIQGKHVLLLNFDQAAEHVHSFDELRELRSSQPAGLVVAPHPFYPARCCLGGLLEQHADLFDAVELNAFYTVTLNHFNRLAVGWARRTGKPIVANADVHRLHQLGSTFSLVDAAPDAGAICAAVRAGRVEIETRPLTFGRAISHLADLTFGHLRG